MLKLSLASTVRQPCGRPTASAEPTKRVLRAPRSSSGQSSTELGDLDLYRQGCILIVLHIRHRIPFTPLSEPPSRIFMAAVGNVARQLRDRTLRERSIRVLVSPTPITFAERRSILQVLEQYGPVEFFKMLPVGLSPPAT